MRLSSQGKGPSGHVKKEKATIEEKLAQAEEVLQELQGEAHSLPESRL